MNRSVSVIVPVRNEAAVLRQSLHGARNAIGPRDQIVVIDNDSIDCTMSIASELADIVIQKSGTVGACRIAGVEAASGDLIFFLDADQVLSQQTISVAVETLDEFNACAIVIPERPIDAGNSLLSKLLGAERKLTELAGAAIPRLIERNAYLIAMASVDGMVFAEDWPLTKLPGVIAMSDVPIFHTESKSMRSLLAKYFDYGRRAARTGKNSPATFGIHDRACAFAKLLKHLDRSDIFWLVPVLILKALKFFALFAGYFSERRRLLIADLKQAN